eukprot:Amastigsp_a510034_9.p2 type:complete len:165 gc:universal Amastigsp_a510034_9:1040-1534(+)
MTSTNDGSHGRCAWIESSQLLTSDSRNAPFWYTVSYAWPVAQKGNSALSDGCGCSRLAYAFMPSAEAPVSKTIPFDHGNATIQAIVVPASAASQCQKQKRPSESPVPRMFCITATNPSGSHRSAVSSVDGPYGERSRTAEDGVDSLPASTHTDVKSLTPSDIST